MEAQELRFMNCLYHKGTDMLVHVRSIITENDSCVSIDLGVNKEDSHIVDVSLFDPVPINRTWLEQLGFKLERGDSEYLSLVLPIPTMYMITLYSTNQNGFSVVWPLRKGENKKEHRLCADVKYIHQLQNLYYSLTGKELIENYRC